MISGFPKPWNPVFIHLLYQNIAKKKTSHGYILENYYVGKYDNFGNPKCCHFSKRRTPKNDEDPSKNFFEILNMGPISI